MSTQFDPRAVAHAASNDRHFRYLAREWQATIELRVDEHSEYLCVDDGTVVAVDAGPADVTIEGSVEAWARSLAPVPEPGDMSMSMTRAVQVRADVVRTAGPYGPAIKRLLRLISQATHGPAPMAWLDHYPFKDSDVAIGRYVYCEVDGVEYRVYYETAGQGTPLLLQHTAGADSRQWRHLLADPAMQADYLMIAYDLPYHGRSLPPTAGVRWWEQDYEVDKDDLLKRIVAVKRALDLDRPVFMGTSIGGQLAPELLGHYPHDFRGAVGINGWYHMDAMAGFTNDHFHHPRIHPDHYAAAMYEATSPLAPEPLRRESSWIYASGGPAIYKGDNEYFMTDHDLRLDGHLVDTARTPYAVVVGEYDPAARVPGGSPEIAANIRGASYHVLEGMSHFAMSDDPVRFNAAIKPILDEVTACADGQDPASW